MAPEYADGLQSNSFASKKYFIKVELLLTVFAFAFLYQILVFNVAMTRFAEEPCPES